MLIPLYCNVEETNTVGDTIITLIPEHVQGISISIEIVLVMDRSDVDTAVLQCGRNKHCRRYDYNSYNRACTGYMYRDSPTYAPAQC